MTEVFVELLGYTGSGNYMCVQCHFKGRHLAWKSLAPVFSYQLQGFSQNKMSSQIQNVLGINIFIIIDGPPPSELCECTRLSIGLSYTFGEGGYLGPQIGNCRKP